LHAYKRLRKLAGLGDRPPKATVLEESRTGLRSLEGSSWLSCGLTLTKPRRRARNPKMLIRTIAAVIFALLTAPAMAGTESSNSNAYPEMIFSEHKEWLQCQSDDDCTTIETSNCFITLPVNTRYSQEARTFASSNVSCNALVPSMPGRPPVGPKCVNSECAIAPR
jgi:hypothetical protein